METSNQNNTSLGKLVSKLKNEDSNYANLSKAIQIVYWIFIPLYSFITVREYMETNDFNDILSGVSFILAFLIFALFFRKYYKEYKYVDYSLPIVQMLKKAAYRYQPFQKKSVWILLALILMDIGLTFDWLDNNTSVLKIQVIFLGLILFAVFMGLILWYIRYKPIRDEALRLIKEIEE